MHGHISANYLNHGELKPPFLTLVVSGGHTNLVYVTGYNECEVIGGTRDDAVEKPMIKLHELWDWGTLEDLRWTKLLKREIPTP